MSEAAAAFFANKKRKKKPFKFNANLVDASSVSQTTHVDAPALSKEVESPPQQQPAPAPAQASAPAAAVPSAPVVSDAEPDRPGGENQGANDGEWDDAPTAGRNKTTAAPQAMDMKSLAQNKANDNISQKLKVEETKAQLAAAREGMEREAARHKAEKERKEQAAKEKEAARAAAVGGGAGGGIWVSARMRAAQTANMPKMRMTGAGQSVDTSNEELFPDLASAGKILEQKEKSSTTVRVPKKTPVGGGASWATKTTNKAPARAPAKAPMKRPVEPPPKNQAKTEPEPQPKAPEPKLPKKEEKPEPAPAPTAPAPAPAAAPALPTVKPKKTGKKKKKDLSSFKPGSS